MGSAPVTSFILIETGRNYMTPKSPSGAEFCTFMPTRTTNRSEIRPPSPFMQAAAKLGETNGVRAPAEACHRSQRPHTEYAHPAAIETGAVDYYIRIFPESKEKDGPFEAGLFGEAHHPDETTLP